MFGSLTRAGQREEIRRFLTVARADHLSGMATGGHIGFNEIRVNKTREDQAVDDLVNTLDDSHDTASPHLRRCISNPTDLPERPIEMYCHSCGKVIPLHSASCPHCGSKIAIQPAVPLPTKTDHKTRAVLSLSAIGVIFIAVLVYALSGGTDQRQSVASLPVSNPSATPLNSSISVEAAAPTVKPASKPASKISASPKSVSGSDSMQLNSAAGSAPAAEGAAPARSLTPKPKRVEETFYITRTGARYHRGSCHHLRRSAYPITRAEAEAQGYTPCRVCYP